ncbi:phosphosugar isomerase [Deinococcus psychrotolerans]|uniref:Phosphosugar isomerase n=1 Tax=Deinococcus psychrotolerans TaxID=2489213 RepID=A0A3G8YAZ2_9DEIO|nr:SIS domain-containing protein [Deinococcus psychrotolerans]AZI42093.1 phosphosugar isomerase [Deinococcus psychrotolerans]
MLPKTSLIDDLLSLPSSYQGPTRALTAPYGIVGVGAGALSAAVLDTLVERKLTKEGTQIVLESADAAQIARDYAGLSEVSGAAVVRAGVQQIGASNRDLTFLAPSGIGATYHLAQFAAYATGHAEDAQAADKLLGALAVKCAPDVDEGNPARDLAWTLWQRTPLLLAAPEDAALTHIWQHLLARVGKTLSIAIAEEPLYVVTGAFEAQHEKGDSKVAVILGDETPELLLAREVLETRIDEVLQVPFPEESSGYAGTLALWYFGAWVAAYLAERHGISAEDSSALKEVLKVLSVGEAVDESGLEA